MSGKEPATQIAPVESPQMVSIVKLPILKKGEYTLWSMRMEQYLTNIDYSLWQVILNGDGPIQVTTDEKVRNFKSSTFIMEQCSLDYEEQRWCRFKAKIRQWNNINKTMKRNRKAAALEKLSSIEMKLIKGSTSPSDTENYLNLLHELEIIDKFASMDLIQKAQVKWDIEGIENTKFFHGLINQKRKNQTINGIMVEGNWITDPSLNKDAYFQFYKVKFQPKTPRPVTHEEIKEAVWDCGSSKAPGPDGFSFAFVKKY
ncbi:hypothetical protein Tco_0065525 [Tanacetum coccineum]